MIGTPPKNRPQPDRARAELRLAAGSAVGLLLAMAVLKPLVAGAGGALVLTLLVALQLYIPLWRAERGRLGYNAIGWQLAAWRRDGLLALALCAVVFPAYAWGYHLCVTRLHAIVLAHGGARWAQHVPHMALATASVPHTWTGMALWLRWLVQSMTLQLLSVALPEETFYRGYLQRQLETLWPPRRSFFGGCLGYAAWTSALVFAASHYLGEWHLWRLTPLFPALIFSWLRSKTDSIAASTGMHAACNVFGEVLLRLYRPV